MRNEINYIEELFLRANNEIDARNYMEAKSLLEEILEIEPTYGRAYNHLAWIYSDILKISEKAEPLYQLALKHAPQYGAPYVNYMYLLLDRYDVKAVEELVTRARKVPDVDKAIIEYISGRASELKGDFKAAYQFYEAAKRLSFNDRFLNDMNAHKQRLLSKLNKLQRVWAILFW